MRWIVLSCKCSENIRHAIFKSDIFSNILRYVERLSAGASIIQMAALSEKLKTFVIICLTDDVLDANQQKI